MAVSLSDWVTGVSTGPAVGPAVGGDAGRGCAVGAGDAVCAVWAGATGATACVLVVTTGGDDLSGLSKATNASAAMPPATTSAPEVSPACRDVGHRKVVQGRSRAESSFNGRERQRGLPGLSLSHQVSGSGICPWPPPARGGAWGGGSFGLMCLPLAGLSGTSFADCSHVRTCGSQ